jgi:hypothetical protein
MTDEQELKTIQAHIDTVMQFADILLAGKKQSENTAINNNNILEEEIDGK